VSDLVTAVWLRSTRCNNSNCLEVAFLHDKVAIRDSKDESGPVLFFSTPEWTAFLHDVRVGRFDLNRDQP
jgi:hypothetical protein